MLHNAPYNEKDNILQKILETIQSKKSIFLFTCFFAALFSFYKIEWIAVSDTLWAEDGTIFVQEALDFSYKSLWKPYAGYIHLYPRLVALLSRYFDFKYTPHVFLVGWLFAYFTYIFVLVHALSQKEKNGFVIFSIVLLTVAQPHGGEVFLTLTNAQWFLGVVLIFVTFLPSIQIDAIWKKIGFIVLVFTGPFSLILLPFLILEKGIKKQWTLNSKELILFIGAAAQAMCLKRSDRINHNAFSERFNVDVFSKSMSNFFFFGKDQTAPEAYYITFFFWIFILCLFVFNRIKKKKTPIYQVLLFLLCFVFFGLGMMLSMPDIMNPNVGYQRYFYIPYTLLFFLISMLVLEYRWAKYGFIMFLFLIDKNAFERYIKRPSQHFEMYAAETKKRDSVSIPVNPPNGEWVIHYRNQK